MSHLPPPVPGGVAPKFGSEKVSRYTGVSQLQLRVSRYTVQLSPSPEYFLKSTAGQMGGVLPYKWEAYCSTNGEVYCWASLSSRLRSQEGPAIQMGGVPFWPECLHIKFPKIYLCKAIFYIFKNQFRKINVCNVIFYLWQINSPEFKYVISWVVQKTMCLWRRFSQEVSSGDANLDALRLCTFLSLHCATNPRFFTEFGLF